MNSSTKVFATASECLRRSAATSSAASAGIPSAASSALARPSRGLELLEVAVGQRAQDPELLGLAQQRRRRLARVPALGELLGGDDLRLLVLERRLDRAGEAQHLVARAAGAVEQPADRLELEAVGLQLADQVDPRLVLGAVVAGAAAHLGRAAAARATGARGCCAPSSRCGARARRSSARQRRPSSGESTCGDEPSPDVTSR